MTRVVPGPGSPRRVAAGVLPSEHALPSASDSGERCLHDRRHDRCYSGWPTNLDVRYDEGRRFATGTGLLKASWVACFQLCLIATGLLLGLIGILITPSVLLAPIAAEASGLLRGWVIDLAGWLSGCLAATVVMGAPLYGRDWIRRTRLTHVTRRSQARTWRGEQEWEDKP
jgi:hypothetical protein